MMGVLERGQTILQISTAYSVFDHDIHHGRNGPISIFHLTLGQSTVIK